MDYGYANYCFIVFMILFCSAIIFCIGYMLGYDNYRKDRNDKTDTEANTENDSKAFSRDSDSDDISDISNSVRVCDFRYLEDLQERINVMRFTLSRYEKEMIDEVNDVLDFVIETLKEYEGVTEEEEDS